MGSKQSKSTATENMKQIKELNVNEKQEQICYYLRLEKMLLKELETNSDKIYYTPPTINLCSYSLT